MSNRCYEACSVRRIYGALVDGDRGALAEEAALAFRPESTNVGQVAVMCALRRCQHAEVLDSETLTPTVDESQTAPCIRGALPNWQADQGLLL